MSDAPKFAVKTILPESRSIAMDTFEIEPSSQQAQVVCGMFGEFLSQRPTEFKDRLEFIQKYDMELEWAAAGGGCAYASFFVSGEPVAMLVLLCGFLQREEQLMLQGLKAAILGRMLGEDADRLMDLPQRPAVLQVILPGQPELTPTLQLLTTSLASVYFQVMLRLAEAESNAASES
jgi:hypothetical protein